jgi:hypothetical protein
MLLSLLLPVASIFSSQSLTAFRGVNHAITLTGAVHNANTGDLMGFYISDSGRGKVNDMTRFVDK